jgi:hypothetical protein
MGRVKPHLTYANVMVTILAFVVLGGVAVAAGGALKKNSVGTKQLKKNAVTRAKIKNGAVNTPKLDPSVLGPYAKRTELLNGNDVVTPDPTAGLSTPIYNVGGAGGAVDCQGTNGIEFPNNKPDDIDFETVDFDSGSVAHTEPSAAANCYNGFSIPRTGRYLVTAFIEWESNPVGFREIAINAVLPAKKCCKVLAFDSTDAVLGPATGETAAAIASLPAGTTIFIAGEQTSGAGLKFLGGGAQIAWLGN